MRQRRPRLKQLVLGCIGIMVLIALSLIPLTRSIFFRNLGWLYLQRALYQQEDPAQATNLRLAGERFTQALSLNPSDKLAADGLGLVYLQYGDSARAVELFERVPDQSFWNDVARMHRLFAETSTMSTDQQRIIGGVAKSWCDPRGLERQIQAFTQEQLCDLAGEWTAWSKSRCELPAEAEAELDHRVGNCYVEMGNWDVGVGHLEQAGRLQPGDARIQLDLGEAWLASNKRTQALRAFQRALQLDPESAEALSRIQELEGD